MYENGDKMAIGARRNNYAGPCRRGQRATNKAVQARNIRPENYATGRTAAKRVRAAGRQNGRAWRQHAINNLQTAGQIWAGREINVATLPNGICTSPTKAVIRMRQQNKPRQSKRAATMAAAIMAWRAWRQRSQRGVITGGRQGGMMRQIQAE